jgi:hypothetical protein
MIFTSTVAGKDEGPFSTFPEAFTNFWTRFIALIKGGISEQVLDWCWITGTFDNGGETPLLWESAKIFAYEVGLLVGEGELQNPAPEIDPAVVEAAFAQAMRDIVTGANQELVDAAEELAKVFARIAERSDISDSDREELRGQLGELRAVVTEFTAAS